MRIPDHADVVIAGGTTAAVAAALAARRAGASVFLIAPRPYLGEDLCATLRLEKPDDAPPRGELQAHLFPDGPRTTPLRIKKTLDRALLNAGIPFLFGAMVVDVLTDPQGHPRGVVMASRCGLQTVATCAIIDATPRAAVARQAGAEATSWPDAPVTFERTLIMPGDGDEPQFVTHSVELSLPDGSYRSLSEAEQQTRDLTYTEGQLRGAESLFFVPPDRILCRAPADDWPEDDCAAADLDHFQTRDIPGLYLLNGCADVPRDVAADLLKPAAMIPLGDRIGAAVGREAAAAASPSAPPQQTGAPCASRVELGPYDVVVVGGGTSGAAAAIAAGRQGARVLVAEYQEALGGMGTVGQITKPYHGRKEGFAAEVPFRSETVNLEHKMDWLRREVRASGGEVWLGAIGCGARVEDGVVCGVTVATPDGLADVAARAVIDATGNADVAAAAGAARLFGATEDGCLALQGVGLPVRNPGQDHCNTDYVLVDESDLLDIWHVLVGTRWAMDEATTFDAGPLIQTRERHRVVGEHVMSYLDQIIGRTYRDSIALSASDYDSHSYTNEIYFALFPHDEKSRKANHPAPGGSCWTPYRCLLPRGLEGLLVIGTGISMRRDATAMVRMQYDLLNQGYAAGVAAAMVVRSGKGLRGIDLRALQRHLVERNCLPPEVLEHEDNFPFDDAAVRQAVRDITGPDRLAACRALAVTLAHRDQAMPLLAEAFEAATGDARLVYAKILGCLGDGRGAGELIAALHEAEWDEKIFQGHMTECAHLPTPVDALVLALGFGGVRHALPEILPMVEQLDASVTMSHHRSVALALERLADPAAASALARLLGKNGMSGHEMLAAEPLVDRPVEKRRREGSLRELILARALYRCGDSAGLGRRILKAYTEDLRGLLSKHARMVLEEN